MFEETKKAAILRLRQIAEECGGDAEKAHALADDLLCCVLRGLGFEEVVAEYEKIEKWYA